MGTTSRQGPVRTCVGCRVAGPRQALLRVVVSAVDTGSPVLVVDVRRAMTGRGAWLHPDTTCFEVAERRRAFGRALRTQGQPVTDAVRRYVEGHAESTTSPGPPGDETDRRDGKRV
ncbi:YlxR family protein [Cellulomonas sp. URHB0016]